MKVLTFSNLVEIFKNRSVAVIGSAPSVKQNEARYINGYDEIIRINNYKTKGVALNKKPYDYTANVGSRTDWHYSFYGASIRKTSEELKKDGIKGHLCKCPNANAHMTEWHKMRGMQKGCDFGWIYRIRKDYWVAPVYIPEKEHYLKCFHLLGGHVPTTGFCCIWEMVNIGPKKIYITGFDFMTSGVHNVDEKWRPGIPDDPIGHVPHKEFEIVKKWIKEIPWVNPDEYLRKRIFG